MLEYSSNEKYSLNKFHNQTKKRDTFPRVSFYILFLKHLILYTTCSIIYLGGEEMVEKIKKAEQVIRALVGLTLELATLIAVIKMLIESI